MGFFLLKVGPPLEKFSGSAPDNMRLFGTSRVTQETMIIGLGFQNIQFTLVILGMVIFRNPPLSIQIKVHLFYNISRSLS